MNPLWNDWADKQTSRHKIFIWRFAEGTGTTVFDSCFVPLSYAAFSKDSHPNLPGGRYSKPCGVRRSRLQVPSPPLSPRLSFHICKVQRRLITAHRFLMQIHEVIYEETLGLSPVSRQCSINIRSWVNSYLLSTNYVPVLILGSGNALISQINQKFLPS